MIHGRLAVLAALAACGGDDVAPSFPAAYATSYVAVRDCRRSSDHDLHFIRVLVEPAALQPYNDRVSPFPVGSVVLKEEYEFDDPSCAGEPVEWTVMVKTSGTERLGWDWQRVEAGRSVVESNGASCYGCHEPCTGIGGAIGYDGTCTEP